MNALEPLVSILMPAYNVEPYIAASIESVLTQTYANWELIIIDDGSKDDTPQLIQRYINQDQRIRAIRHDENKGLIETRNRGLQEAKGKYIANLDSDDIARVDRLSEQVKYLESKPDIMMVGTACETIDSSGKKTGVIHREIPDAHINVILLFSNYFINSTVMFRAEIVKSVGYSKDMPIAEDYNLFVELSKRGALANLDKVLVQYRVHGENISLKQEKNIDTAVEAIQQKQLSTMSIEATDSELTMHRSLVEGKALALGYNLLEVQTWLLRVIAANAVSKSYDEKLLGHYCAFFYRRACETSGLGTKAIRQFRKSPLFDLLRKDLKGNFAFLIKSLTKHTYVQ